MSEMPTPTPNDRTPASLLLVGLLVALIGLTLESGWAQGDETQVIPTLGVGGTADSNGRMIAVTGVDVTGQSILYLVDTEGQQICVYQASGGSSSTQGVKFVGARRIELDLLLDGFNDKTESNGKALVFKDLQRMFEAQGRTVQER
jgi:hypothetical protein